jgi:hypothetical protein
VVVVVVVVVVEEEEQVCHNYNPQLQLPIHPGHKILHIHLYHQDIHLPTANDKSSNLNMQLQNLFLILI